MEGHTASWEMKGKIFTFDMVQKLVAFTNDIQSDQVLIYIGGLQDTILSTPFTSELSNFCTNKGIKLIIPQLKSMPNFRIFPISNDVENIHKIVLENVGKKITLLGHSTGCQISLLYLKTHGSQNIEKIIIQAPVSDVEYFQSVNHNLSKQLQKAKQTQCFVSQFDGQIWLSKRFISLMERFNTEDLFSSHLEDQSYSSWKKFNIPIISIVGEKDQYSVISNIQKLKLGSQVFVIQGATHALEQSQSQKQFFRILNEKL